MDTPEFREFVARHADRFAGVRPESDASLDAAESQLGHALPQSFRWLLSTHGYSGPCGISSLTDSMSATLRCREALQLPSHYFIMNDWGDVGVVYMDMRSGTIYWADAAALDSVSDEVPAGADVYEDYPAWVADRLEADEA